MPIAIVGMSCRFSGGADSPEKLWKLLAEGRNTWTKVPGSRYNQTAFYHPEGTRAGVVGSMNFLASSTQFYCFSLNSLFLCLYMLTADDTLSPTLRALTSSSGMSPTLTHPFSTSLPR